MNLFGEERKGWEKEEEELWQPEMNRHTHPTTLSFKCVELTRLID